MEPNIPTPINVPPSQQPRDSQQVAHGESVSPRASTINTIRTMKMDSALAVKNQNETLVSMTLAEERKKAARREEIAMKQASVTPGAKPAPKPIGRFVIILGLIILTGGISFAVKLAIPVLRKVSLPAISLPTLHTFGTSEPGKVSTTPIENIALIPSLIPARSEKRFIINKDTPGHLFSMTANERIAGVTPGSIRNLYFAEESTDADNKVVITSISADRLLLLSGITTPAILTRSLETAFMLGLYGEEGSQATPFLVLKVSGYDTGLAGMLAWEKDLPQFFDTVFGTKFLAGPSTLFKFHNTVVLGHDVRALEGLSAGSIFYTLADPSTVIVTGSQTALEALLPLLPIH